MAPRTSSSVSIRHVAERTLKRVWFGGGMVARIGAAMATPLSRITAWASARRRKQIDALAPPPVPVVVVGNLVVGGSGKTPLVIALARALGLQGRTAGMLCSGYGASRQDARLVPADADAREHGDEAVLLARAGCGPVAAGRNRGEALVLLLRAHPEIDVVLSDDGLQHVHLPRTVEIAVFDRRGVGNGRLLPAGPLREPLAVLTQFDAVALNGPATSPVTHPRVFGFRISAQRFVPLSGDAPPVDARDFARQIADRRVAAIAGIGEPERFFDTLAALGISAQTMSLADHGTIDPQRLKSLAVDLVLMTAKDAVKCAGISDSRCWVLEVTAEPDPRMIHWLTEVLVGHTAA
jgi:tetraacyldisaccharide 4'-kinase